MANGEGSEQYTVLIVEDEATHQMLIRKGLAREGSPFGVVQFARDSDEAVRFAQQMRFDVLLCDNRIPGKRGLDLLTELREVGVDAPFVLMTSAGSEDLVVQAYRKNVDDYVIKDSGFWKDLPQVLLRVIRSDRAKKREQALRERLERTNAKLDKLNAQIGHKNAQITAKVRELRAALETCLQQAKGDVKAPVEQAQALLTEVEGLL